MKNIYKTSGLWNIACAVLYMASCIVSVSFLQLELALSISGETEGMRALFLSVYWTMLLGFPFFMTVTGGAMLFVRRKGTGMRILILFNVLLKLCGIVYDLYFGCTYLGMGVQNTIVGGLILFAVAACMGVSVVMDLKAILKTWII